LARLSVSRPSGFNLRLEIGDGGYQWGEWKDGGALPDALDRIDDVQEGDQIILGSI
jgi:hypothetical protein